MEAIKGRKSTLVVVEDDPHGLVFLESGLALAGFDVITAKSVPQAIKRVEKAGIRNISAVITDYRLPGPNGIDFLRWIKSHDENLATVIVTGQGEKSVVKAALAEGAFDYLDKPVTYQMIVSTAHKAVDYTQKLRRYQADRRSLEELERLDTIFNRRLPESLAENLRLYYRPLHETGGDFLITHDNLKGRIIILVGDVSGHDIHAGYVSTYFQGLFRGYMENASSIDGALRLFNHALREDLVQPNDAAVPISVAVSVLEIQLSNNQLLHWNYGQMPCVLFDRNGFVTHGPFGNFPLGWVDAINTDPLQIRASDFSAVCIYTDGLLDFAGDLGVSPLALFYKTLHTKNFYADLPLKPADDILCIRLDLIPMTASLTSFEPIISEHYAGTEIEHIDHLQSVWRRSIHFALDDQMGDRLYDLLICIREGMINAFVHGCNRAPDKFAHLTVSVDSAKQLLRIRIDDPGRGHKFDLQKRLDELQKETGNHLGLGIIHHLSDDFLIDNEGTTLLFDFKITPEKE